MAAEQREQRRVYATARGERATADILPETGPSQLTAVHLITGVVAVHFLVTLAGVGDAASASALELVGGAQRGCQA